MDEVPFFANTVDNTHCVQACFRMALKYFLPELDFNFGKLDAMTHKVEKKGTWWFPGLVELKKLGIQSKMICAFDYKRYL